MVLFSKNDPATSWAPRFGTFTRVSNSTDQILDGQLKLSSFPAVGFEVSQPKWTGLTDGQFVDDPGWWLYFYSLTWVGDILLDANIEESRDRQKELVEVSSSLAKSWWEAQLEEGDAMPNSTSSHGVAMRCAVMVLLWQLSKDDWILNALRWHIDQLTSQFSGFWNHGLVESISLYGASSELEEDDSKELARARLHGCFEEMVDEQGATSEQAPTYSGYVWRLFNRSLALFEAYGEKIETEPLRRKIENLEQFILHSLRPDKRFIEIGDSYPDFPGNYPGSVVDRFVRPSVGGPELSGTKAVFSSGYIFSRASWEMDAPEPNNTYFSLRFGPGRAVHGHNDHMSATMWSYGRDILVDSGHIGYKDTPLRRHFQSHDAHNVLAVAGRKFNSEEETVLLFAESGEASKYSFMHVAMEDSAYSAVDRRREVLCLDRGPLVTLDDAVESSGEGAIFTQLWHFSPEFNLTESGIEYVRLDSVKGDLAVFVLHFDLLSADGKGSNGIHYWRGAENPLQGWTSAGRRKAIPNPTIGVNSRASKAQILTAVVPIETESTLTWSVRPYGKLNRILRISIDGNVIPVEIVNERQREKAQLRLLG